MEKTVAIIIPCFNESQTIEKVVSDCRRYCPKASIFVFDNNSTDDTMELALKAGAKVIKSNRQGKGATIRHAFQTIEADYFVMVDGDDTYPIEDLPRLLDKMRSESLDMLIGTRLETYTKSAFRKSHYFGNQIFSKFVNLIFKTNLHDLFSGYRIFSRSFVDSVVISSDGFEIETELTLHAVSMDFKVGEMPILYRNRPKGSHSKLNTFSDGYRILKFIFTILKDHRPLFFFATLSWLCFIFALISGIAPIEDYLTYAYVFTVPRAILAASLIILSAVFLCVGLILDSQRKYFKHQALLNQRYMNKKSQPPYQNVKRDSA